MIWWTLAKGNRDQSVKEVGGDLHMKPRLWAEDHEVEPQPWSEHPGSPGGKGMAAIAPSASAACHTHGTPPRQAGLPTFVAEGHELSLSGVI